MFGGFGKLSCGAHALRQGQSDEGIKAHAPPIVASEAVVYLIALLSQRRVCKETLSKHHHSMGDILTTAHIL